MIVEFSERSFLRISTVDPRAGIEGKREGEKEKVKVKVKMRS